jgi:polyphosphate kinase 2 (PPK2 family)
MRKLNAVVDASGKDGILIVTVTDMDTKEEYVLTIKATTEKEAAFKAMEQINGQ